MADRPSFQLQRCREYPVARRAPGDDARLQLARAPGHPLAGTRGALGDGLGAVAVTPDAFIAKWRASELKERSAAQEHFIDLCRLLGEPTPAEADPRGEWYSFERGATKTAGGAGWADVWKRGHFAWEYKGRDKDLGAAFSQLQQYALALENPPLLVVCDTGRFEIRTNWTNSVSQVHALALDDLRDASKFRILKWVLSDPEKLRPSKTRQALTEEAAGGFARLALALRSRGHDPQRVAHFVNRLVFCMFAEDIELLPNAMFSRMLEAARSQPEDFERLASSLFSAMRQGGNIGFERVEWFNGGLFDDDDALPLTKEEVGEVLATARLDWSDIDPSIFGTLFERGLDPDKRSQLGAHYTDRDKIMQIVEPVIVRPWLERWSARREEIASELERSAMAKDPGQRTRRQQKAATLYRGFLDELRAWRVLDPACGSGNFLYLALHALKNIEHRAGLDVEALGLQREFPAVGPESVRGIEINPYAAELARVTVWIGEIQWMRRNGFSAARNPILKPLETIECRDAVLGPDGKEAPWPDADAVIGNPPFLGDRRMISVLGESQSEALRAAWRGRVPRGADLVCYWFEKARDLLSSDRIERFGLVATNSIRGGQNRAVLNRLLESCVIFDAWSDEEWTINGAAVRVALICAVKATDAAPRLNGSTVEKIYSDLTTGELDLTKAKALAENRGVCLHGSKKIGSFDVDGETARRWLLAPRNPNGRPNSNVLVPVLNGADVTGRSGDRWIIDFGLSMPLSEAMLYELPFRHVEEVVRPEREKNRNPALVEKWWLHGGPRPALRKALPGLSRCIATPAVSKHRLFVWVAKPILPDAQLMVTLRDDDCTFGILHSRFH